MLVEETVSDTVVSSIMDLSVGDFIAEMNALNIKKGYFTFIDNQLHTSNEALNTIKTFIQKSPDFHQHEGIFFQINTAANCLYLATIHNTSRGAGHGGTRMKQYNNIHSIFTDGMRLAKGMTDKNACAKIWWGGGKGIIATTIDPRTIKGKAREQVFTEYGLFVASLNGLYICAEDMNTSPEDMRIIHASNRFCTCLPVEIGGSSNPSAYTAIGVFSGLLAGSHYLDGKNNQADQNLKGKHILLQGAGNVGGRLLKQLVKCGAKVTVFDPRRTTQDTIRATYPADQVTVIEDGEALYDIKADIFSPNAIGAILNDDTIQRLNVKLIAGGANNQLKDPVKHAQQLADKGILYVPDFILNRMGIVNCANEPNGYLEDEVKEAAEQVYPAVYDILEAATIKKHSPQFEAMDLAAELSKVPHPILGHRGLRIVRKLMRNGWEH